MPVLTILKTTDEKAKKKKQRNSKTKFFKSVLSSLNESDRSTEPARSALLRRRGGEGLRREECGVGSPLAIQICTDGEGGMDWRRRTFCQRLGVLTFLLIYFFWKKMFIYLYEGRGLGVTAIFARLVMWAHKTTKLWVYKVKLVFETYNPHMVYSFKYCIIVLYRPVWLTSPQVRFRFSSRSILYQIPVKIPWFPIKNFSYNY